MAQRQKKAEGVTPTAPTGMSPTPSISIYQQPDHVAGLLQQLEGPLLQGEKQTRGSDAETPRRDAEGLTSGGAADVGAPWLSRSDGRAGRREDGGDEARHVSSERRELEFIYSQAYYLHRVRTILRARGLVRTITSAKDADSLASGAFVEYEAKFRPDQISTALDVLTPVLVQQIVRKVKFSTFAKVTDFGEHQTLQSAMAKFKEQLDVDLTFAGALTEAVRADFRSDRTKEFYGTIGDGEDAITAVTICDVDHFTVADVDRILDGRFTVLGKVSEGIEVDRPVLERNKLLDKLSPAAVDDLFRSANSSLSKGTDAMGGQFKLEGKSDVSKGNPLDGLRLESRIAGPSFRVIPVAVFT